MSDTPTTLGRILLVLSEAENTDHLVEALQQLGDLRVEHDTDGARAALQGDPFDLVITTRPDLLPAESRDTRRGLGEVLDAIGQGVAIVDGQGNTLWSNARVQDIPPEVWERVKKHCVDTYERARGKPSFRRPGLLSVAVEDDRYFDATLTLLADEAGDEPRWVAVVSDVTRARRLQKKMDAIDNAGRELVRVDTDQLARMDVRQRLELLERKILRYTHELLHFDNFAIRLLDKKSNRLELVLCAGLTPEGEEIDIYASTENGGISGYVAATGRSYICPDIQLDPRYLVGIDNARSSLTVPLRLHDQVIGVLNIESDRLAAFSEDDRQFAEIFGRYVAIALHILDLLVVERCATTGRLADNVSAEIAAPLGDILADATTLMEDYIGHDDLRRRLQGITDNVIRIKEAIKQVTRPTGGILGARPVEPVDDPLLSGRKVLVVDDEETILMAVRDVLTRQGCEVEMARDGNEAIAMISRRSYDLVISDIRLPGHSGYEIFAAARKHCPECPVIFITGFGYDPNHSIIRANKEGLASVLYKPFKVDQLLGDVRAAVAKPGA